MYLSKNLLETNFRSKYIIVKNSTLYIIIFLYILIYLEH